MGAVAKEIAAFDSNPRLSTATLLAGAKCVLKKYGAFIDKHRGTIPASVVAVRIFVETGDALKPSTECAHASTETTNSLGIRELGLLMLWEDSTVPACAGRFGYTGTTWWKDPEKNIRCGCWHWENAMRTLKSPWSGPDRWAVAQLNTMVGAGATAKLIAASGATSFSSLVSWVKSTSDELERWRAWYGTQSSALVARRVLAANNMTAAARSIGGLGDFPAGLIFLAAGLVALRYALA